MGAWGKGSFQNDTALDFVPDIVNFKNVKKLINKKQKSGYEYHYYDEVRVVAEILLHLHKINMIWTDQEIIDLLIARLEVMLADGDWFSTWRYEKDAKDIRKDIKRFIKGLKQITGY